MRTQCVESFLESLTAPTSQPKTYWDWLSARWAGVRGDLSRRVHRKYWTTEPANLSTEWVGIRILKPDVEEVLNGARGLSGRTTSHYIAKSDARYPTHGGFMGYTHKMAAGADIRYGHGSSRWTSSGGSSTFANGTELPTTT